VALEAPARVVVLMDRPLIAETVALTLNHGVYLARVVPTVAEAAALLGAWAPHLAVVDLDLGDGGLLRALGLARATGRSAVPVLGLPAAATSRPSSPPSTRASTTS
jgi:DNA-binding response OmpR family regulator